jgi:hypothetical protein
VFRSPGTSNRLLVRRSAEVSPENILPKITPLATPRIVEVESVKPGHRRTKSDRVAPLSKQPSNIFAPPLFEASSRTRRREPTVSSRKKSEDSHEEPAKQDLFVILRSHFDIQRTVPETTVEFY